MATFVECEAGLELGLCTCTVHAALGLELGLCTYTVHAGGGLELGLSHVRMWDMSK